MDKINLNTDITTLSVEQKIALYRRVKQLRLDTEHALAPVQTMEKSLKEALIAEIPKAGEGVVSGGYLTRVTTKRKPIIGDWDAILAYIGETGRFDFLRKQLADKAVTDTEGWDQLPGIEVFNALDLSITRV